ncbi:MAG: hypothetical protein KatS3mg110_4361 [Pirellulaceae bacterium]|nr:MAG: hypothetical protein KatS3mg110_4361 [Pirellulaceae bacterium]
MANKIPGGCRTGFLVLLVLAASAMNLVAQDASSGEEASADTPDSGSLREQTIYVPFEKLERVFEREGRGVFLPYEKFQELWRAAQSALRPTPPVQPPADAIIQRIRTDAVASGDVLLARAELEIDFLKPGWHRVPLRLDDVAIRSARIDGQPARLVPDERGAVVLLYEVPEKSSTRSIRLILEYAKAIEKVPGRNSVVVHPPQASINEWRVAVPESGVHIQIQPALALSPEPVPPAPEGMEQTAVRAFTGPAEEVRIEWNPQSQGAAGVATLAAAELQQEFYIDESSVRCRTAVTYQLSSGMLEQIRLRVPSQYRVVGVFDANVRQWQVTGDGTVQMVLVDLFEPARANQSLLVELERFDIDPTAEDVTLPLIEALDAGRQQGTIVVRMSESLRAAVRQRRGLVQVDTSELPEAVRNQSWSFAFRYVTLPYELTLAVEKISPEVDLQQHVVAYLEPKQLSVDLFAVLDVRQSGLFQISIVAPPGWRPNRVRGEAAPEVEAVVVDSFQPHPEQPDTWIINLARKATGRVGVRVEWSKVLDEPNLQAPTGQPARIELVVPRVEPPGLQRLDGFLVIAAPESLRLLPASVTGMQSVAPGATGTPHFLLRRPGSDVSVQPSMAFAFGTEPARLELSAERRQPQVHVRQALRVHVQPGVVQYESRFYYAVRYSPVKSLRIDLPSAVAARVRNTTAGVRDERIEPQPADVADGTVAWQFAGDREFFGEFSISLAWEEPLAALNVGQTVRLPVPFLRAVGVDQAWGQILISRSETLHVEPSDWSPALREIDPRHDLMPSVDGSGISRAFEFHEPYELTLAATRFELLDLKRTQIEAALIRAVATRSRQLDVQALYRVQSVRQRLAIAFPASVDPSRSFDAEPVRVNGRSVPLEKTGDGQFQIPLASITPGSPFVLEVRYSVPDPSNRIELPSFPENPAIGKVYLSVYHPEDQVLVAVHGPWSDEQPDVWEALWTSGHEPLSDEEIFQREVAHGTEVDGSTLARFRVQGRRYLYSTLQPEPPPAGNLGWRSIDERVFWGTFLGGALLVGLLFLAQPLHRKLAVLGIAWVGAMGLAILAPTLARQLLASQLQLGVLAVLGVWFVAEAVKAASTGRSLVRQWWSRASVDSGRQPATEMPADERTREIEQRVSRVLDEWQPGQTSRPTGELSPGDAEGDQVRPDQPSDTGTSTSNDANQGETS